VCDTGGQEHQRQVRFCSVLCVAIGVCLVNKSASDRWGFVVYFVL
jgi:hypothetical protein